MPSGQRDERLRHVIHSHERVLQQHKVKAETTQTAVRIASVVKAVATVHATLG